MIDYIGDISRNDARLLEQEARSCGRILEFGAGASTQVLATSGAGVLHTLDTSVDWIKRTERNLNRFIVHRHVTFTRYDSYNYDDGPWDLIFVDGIDQQRLRFALRSWALLSPGGCMLFHDTRRLMPHGGVQFTDLQNALQVAQSYSPEVLRVEFNKDFSNITVVQKRFDGPLEYEDWNVVEKRTPAQRGY